MIRVTFFWMRDAHLLEVREAAKGLGYEEFTLIDDMRRGDFIVMGSDSPTYISTTSRDEIEVAVFARADEVTAIVISRDTFLFSCVKKRLDRNQGLPRGGLSNPKPRKIDL